MRLTETVYKRTQCGTIIYDGMLRYCDELGKRRTKHSERDTPIT